MNEAVQLFQKSFSLNFGKYPLSVSFLQAGAIVFLIFLLILLFAQFRRHYIDWSLKGAVFGIFFGFLLALILEGFLIIGGKTALTEVLGWKDAPKPIQIALESGRSQLIKVLGVQAQIPASFARENSSVQGSIESLQSLSPSDLKKVKTLICQP